MASDQLTELADKIGGNAGKSVAVLAFLASTVRKVVHSIRRSARVEEMVRQLKAKSDEQAVTIQTVRELKHTSEEQAKAIAVVRADGIAVKRDVVALRELIERVDDGARSNAEQIREQVSGVGERVDRVYELMVKQNQGGRT